MGLKYTRSHRRQTVEGFQAILYRLAAVATVATSPDGGWCSVILYRLAAVATVATVARRWTVDSFRS